MKFRYLSSLYLVCFIILAVIGIANRSSYSNITCNEDYLSYFEVAEISEDLAQHESSVLATILPKQPVILQVTPIESIEHI